MATPSIRCLFQPFAGPRPVRLADRRPAKVYRPNILADRLRRIKGFRRRLSRGREPGVLTVRIGFQGWPGPVAALQIRGEWPTGEARPPPLPLSLQPGRSRRMPWEVGWFAGERRSGGAGRTSRSSPLPCPEPRLRLLIAPLTIDGEPRPRRPVLPDRTQP